MTAAAAVLPCQPITARSALSSASQLGPAPCPSGQSATQVRKERGVAPVTRKCGGAAKGRGRQTSWRHEARAAQEAASCVCAAAAGHPHPQVRRGQAGDDCIVRGCFVLTTASIAGDKVMYPLQGVPTGKIAPTSCAGVTQTGSESKWTQHLPCSPQI